MKPVCKVAVETTFLDVEKMIYSFTNKFVRKWRLDPEEVMSAAFLGFVQAFHTYRKSKGEFTTWVGHKVTRRIQDVLRKHIQYTRRPERNGLDLETLDVAVEDTGRFNFEEWVEGLSKDARKVARLAVRQPIDVQAIRAMLGEDSPGNNRTAIREYLTERGWSKDRIQQAFLEIKEN